MPGNYPMGQVSNFPEGFNFGLTLRNVPLLQSQPGSAIWLDNNGSNNVNQHPGSDSNRGSFRDPVATLNHALAICQGGRGDLIIVAPGHAETISSATAISMNTSDVAIIGLGGGTTRPQFTLDTAATSTINVTGNNLSFNNCQFVANFLNITALFTMANAVFTGNIPAGGNILNVTAVSSGTINTGNAVLGTGLLTPAVILNQISGTVGGVGVYALANTYTAAVASTTMTVQTQGFALDGCEVRDTSSALNFLNLFAVGTASNATDQLSITRNKIYLKATSGVVTLAQPTGTNDRWYIADNDYISATTNAGAVIPVSTGKVLTNLKILRNYWNIQNASGTSTGWLMTTNGTTNSGFMDGNVSHGIPTSPVNITASSGIAYGLNYWADVADLAGYLVPAADS